MTAAPALPWLKAYPSGIDWRADLPPRTLPALFDAAARQWPGRTCLDFMGNKYTYAETAALVARFAAGLRARGAGPGTKVGLCLPNTPFYPIAYFGALRAGATVVNFNPLYAAPEIEHQIRDSGTEIMVTLDLKRIAPKVEAMLGKTSLRTVIHCDLADVLPPGKRHGFKILQALKGLAGKADTSRPPGGPAHVSWRALMDNDGRHAPVDIKPDDVAVLQYTGGTTGVPKAAALTHANISVNVEQARLWLMAGGGTGEMTMLAVLPFFHVFSMTVQMNLTLATGGALVMLPRFDAGQVLDTIEKTKATVFAGVPTLYRALLDAPGVEGRDLSSLSLCVSGGAALAPDVAERWKNLTGLELVEGYGLSETSPLALANPVAGRKKAGSIGLPMPRTEIRITGLESGAALPPGEKGEICIRGPQVMKAYHANPAETQKVFDAEGFFHTGDVGYMDDEGYVFIADRIKDMINASGLKVFPRRVEEAILEHGGVAEVIVDGVEDAYRGETVKAYIVMKQGQAVGEAALREFLKLRLAPYEIPTLCEFRDSLPKTMIGKPDKKALRAEEKARGKK